VFRRVWVAEQGLMCSGVAGLLNKMGRRRVTVGMDGSLYKFHPHFHDRMVTKVRTDLQLNVSITHNLLCVG
jgi:hexokinase